MSNPRTDWLPSHEDRARLAGRSPVESPGYRLASLLRNLNSRISRLDVAQQQELQPEWIESWERLQADLETAGQDREARFTVIDTWAQTWDERLAKTT